MRRTAPGRAKTKSRGSVRGKTGTTMCKETSQSQNGNAKIVRQILGDTSLSAIGGPNSRFSARNTTRQSDIGCFWVIVDS